MGNAGKENEKVAERTVEVYKEIKNNREVTI
jgi:hypothetical protein